ncbi:hypothetical protein [Bradyrhizobium sp. C9]|uniref:hypothetical protein n=1 Tax=Bradyrhizobium sp. C9 TaxID=142585 RepID=UPI0011773321|nr:hypothetical protein [Bradyrhizobium sp. C9]
MKANSFAERVLGTTSLIVLSAAAMIGAQQPAAAQTGIYGGGSTLSSLARCGRSSTAMRARRWLIRAPLPCAARRNVEVPQRRVRDVDDGEITRVRSRWEYRRHRRHNKPLIR